MSTTLITVLASGVTALFLIGVFSIERNRGKRFGGGFRDIIDRTLVGIGRGIARRLPEINSAFLQELVHFITHLILSKTLGFLRSLESLTLAVVRFNRKQAIKLRRKARSAGEGVATVTTPSEPAPTSEHLQAVIEHKKSIELTDKQKEKRKNAALEGYTKH